MECNTDHPTLDLQCQRSVNHEGAHTTVDEDDNPHARVDAEPDATVDYESLTVPELRNLVKSAGITGYSSLNKQQLIALLS
jgi:hypothetical protein